MRKNKKHLHECKGTSRQAMFKLYLNNSLQSEWWQQGGEEAVDFYHWKES